MMVDWVRALELDQQLRLDMVPSRALPVLLSLDDIGWSKCMAAGRRSRSADAPVDPPRAQTISDQLQAYSPALERTVESTAAPAIPPKARRLACS